MLRGAKRRAPNARSRKIAQLSAPGVVFRGVRKDRTENFRAFLRASWLIPIQGVVVV